MRASIERLYMTVGVGFLQTVKHIARLRSWRETRRTAWFAGVYFVAWLFDLIVPVLIAVMLCLVVYTPSREFLFPPAPIALVSSKTGGVQKPKSGVLGSHDSATGAPENHKGEATEMEAANFVNGIASVALSSAAGKHPQGDPDSEGDGATAAAPDPTAIAQKVSDAKDKAAGAKTGAKHDKTKVPMETAMWTKMRPVMHIIGDITDTWERMAKYDQPIHPQGQSANFHFSQCPLADTAFSQRDVSNASCGRHHAFARNLSLRHFLHVHQRRHIWHRIRFLW